MERPRDAPLSRTDKLRYSTHAVEINKSAAGKIAPIYNQCEWRRANHNSAGSQRRYRRQRVLDHRGKLFELPPPGVGVATVTGTFPTFEAVMADAGIVAVR